MKTLLIQNTGYFFVSNQLSVNVTQVKEVTSV